MAEQLCVICDEPFTEASPDDDEICARCDNEAVSETRAILRAAGIDPDGDPQTIASEVRARVARGEMECHQTPQSIAYLAAVKAAPFGAIAQWLTMTCTECDHEPIAEGTESDHGMVGDFVIIGCQGYYLVNPAAVGLDPGMWGDWTKSDED